MPRSTTSSPEVIDYSKVISRERIERMREIAKRGDYAPANSIVLELIEHAKVFDMALQSLTPGGSEYVNDPKFCVERAREIRETHHRLIAKFGTEAKQLREALRGAMKLPRPWMDAAAGKTAATASTTFADWAEAFDKIETALAAEQ